MTPALPTRETLSFLERVLPPAPSRILEVGAGDGAVSLALAGRGYHVAAIDESFDPAAGGEAVHWIEQDFLHYDGEGAFDVVLFTRSLHHMAPLDDALDRALQALAKEGRVIAEEFAYDRVNLPTARWFYDLKTVLAAAGLLQGEGTEEDGNPLGRWRREHVADPPLPTGHSILAVARARLDLTLVEEAPYLYRYIWDELTDVEGARQAAEAVLRIERRLTRERDIAAAGLRFVGTPLG